MSDDTKPGDMRIYDEEKPLRAFTDEMCEEAKELLNEVGCLPEDMRKKAENTAWRFREETGAMLEMIGMKTWHRDAKAIKEAERGLRDAYDIQFYRHYVRLRNETSAGGSDKVRP